MKKESFFRMAGTLIFALFLFSCQKAISPKPDAGLLPDVASGKADQSEKFNTFYGPEVTMGNGRARSWIRISHTNVPDAIGVEMTHGALSGLPMDPADFAAGTFVLPIHQKAADLTPFDHIVINWNVHGHEPPDVYDVPHFDFHFYRISLEAQLAIPPYPLAMAQFDNFPPAGYLPAMYVATPEGVPQMGKHWVDVLSPEFNGQPFTYTFIYGTYSGKVTFLEPMITLAILQAGQTFHIPIRQPQYFEPTNKYYPTMYNIYMDPSTQKHYVSLSGFVWR